MSSELLLLIGISFSLGFTPGPNNAVASYSAFNFGFKKTIPLIMGVGLGYTVLVILINFVLLSLFKEYPIIQEIIRILGTIFLIYLAYKIATADISNGELKKNPVTFYDTFIFQFINPKAWSIAVTVASGFFPTDENIFIGVGFVTITAAVICFPTISLWALFGSGLRRFVNDIKIKKIIEYLLAVLLVLTGLFILIK